MIKQMLIGASALALMAGAAHAQTIGVPGPDNLNPYFTLTGTNNQSDVQQTLNNNVANVDQTGASSATAANKSQITQGKAGGFASQNNRADVDQNGAGNKVNIAQVTTSSDNTPYIGGLPPVTNLGPYNADGQLQSGGIGAFAVTNAQLGAGSTNRVIVNQSQTNSSGGNQAVVLQGTTMTGATAGVSRSLVTIDQTGGGNRAAIQQGATSTTVADNEDGNMISTVKQDGRRNVAENVQGEVDRSLIAQQGNDNKAFVNQAPVTDPTGVDAYARQSTLHQIGNGNTAVVSQTNSRNASVLWQGNDASVYTDQPVTSATLNTALVTQAGTDGYAETWQGVARSSSLNLADINQTATSTGAISGSYQNGDLNGVKVTQSGANDDSFASQGRQTVNASGTSRLNAIQIEQLGASQISDARQGYERDSDGNIIRVKQDTTATNAKSYVQQEGDLNYAKVYQSGANAYSTVDQDGNGNSAKVDQLGANTNSSVLQTGNMNAATIYQFGTGALSTVTQTGNMNTANVSQIVANAGSNVNQVGNNNTTNINQ